MNKLTYSQHTNGCSPNKVIVQDDSLEITFGFMWQKFKTFKIYAEIEEGDIGGTYLDFSVVEFYKERILKSNCNSFDIKAVEGGGILLIFQNTKIFVAGYTRSCYYTANIKLVIEYKEYNRNGIIEESHKKEIDLSEHIAYA